MSHVLARLGSTRFWGDDLLVRGPSGLALTSGAKEIAPRVAAVLNAARAIYRPPPFEPSKVRRVLHIGGCDTHSILFVPDLINRIRAQAPGIELSIQNYIRDIFKRLGPQGRAAPQSAHVDRRQAQPNLVVAFPGGKGTANMVGAGPGHVLELITVPQ
jgi:DNA-binding transcriptional LysR family regulator